MQVLTLVLMTVLVLATTVLLSAVVVTAVVVLIVLTVKTMLLDLLVFPMASTVRDDGEGVVHSSKCVGDTAGVFGGICTGFVVNAGGRGQLLDAEKACI